MPGRRIDPLKLFVFHHLLSSVPEEMGATLLRSSFSPNIRERRDFSCAIFDGRGRMIAQASHLPIHLGSTPMSVEAVRARLALEPGDAAVLNDPYAGGTHLPDITFVSPVFLPGSRVPDFYCANRAHHADVGGLEPGSMARVSDVHGEGLRIPPLRLVRGGAVDREVLALLLANMRVPSEREGDLLAQWSTNRVGEARLHELAREHGARELRARAEDLLDWSERLTREFLAGLPDGVARFEDELEDGADDARDFARIRVRLEKRAQRLVFDLRATDARPGSSLNATRAVSVSAVFYALRLFLPAFAPANAGILRPVEVRTRPGTLVDAAYPSCVAAGNVETSQRLVDCLLGVFGRLLPGRVPAQSSGTMSNLTFGGPLPEGGSERAPFAYYETIAGGAGASRAGPGAHAVHTHMTNTRNTPIEELETAYPVRVLALALRRGSGGKGASNGGDGLTKRLLFLEDVQASFVGERHVHGPRGTAGGGAGSTGGLSIRRPGERGPRRFRGRWSGALPRGSELEIRTPGGGGFGAP
jgi:N-methylhydantoinase B